MSFVIGDSDWLEGVKQREQCSLDPVCLGIRIAHIQTHTSYEDGKKSSVEFC